MTWGQEALGLERPHHRRMSRIPRRPYPVALEGDHFAPYLSRECVSPSGYCRAEHSYDRDGVCVFCSRRESK